MTPTPTEVEELAEEVRLAKLLAYTDTATWILARFVRREEHLRKIAALANDICGLMLENDRLRAELRGQRCDGLGQLFVFREVGESRNSFACPGCPACKPRATPKSGECICGDWQSYGSLKGCPIHDGGRTPESVSEAEHQASELGASRAESAAPVNYCPECDGVLGKHVDWCSLAAPASLTPESMSVLEQHCSDADFETIGKMRDESYADGYDAGRDDAARLNVQEVVHIVQLHEDTVRALVGAILSLQFEPAIRLYRPTEEDDLLAKLKEMKR